MSDTEQKAKKTPSQASAWLAKFGIKGGGWYQEVKASVQRAMRSGSFSQAARVWLCLRLHTIPYKSELAMKTVRDPETDKPTPVKLTPADVAEETGLSRQDVREAMEQLEAEGMAERRAIDGTDLRKANVELYCWVVPRPAPEPKFVAGHGYKLPQDLLKAIHRFGIRLPPDFVAESGYISRVREALTGYKNAEKVAREALKSAFLVAPAATTYKDVEKPPIESADRVRPASAVDSSFKEKTDGRTDGSLTSNTVETPNGTAPVRPSVSSFSNESLKDKIRTYLLNNSPVPSPLEDDMLTRICREVQSEKAFELFQKKCEQVKGTAQKWALYIKLAGEANIRAGTFQESSAAKPLTKLERMKKEYLEKHNGTSATA